MLLLYLLWVWTTFLLVSLVSLVLSLYITYFAILNCLKYPNIYYWKKSNKFKICINHIAIAVVLITLGINNSSFSFIYFFILIILYHLYYKCKLLRLPKFIVNNKLTILTRSNIVLPLPFIRIIVYICQIYQLPLLCQHLFCLLILYLLCPYSYISIIYYTCVFYSYT